jgi:hypothetical protein
MEIERWKKVIEGEKKEKKTIWSIISWTRWPRMPKGEVVNVPIHSLWVWGYDDRWEGMRENRSRSSIWTMLITISKKYLKIHRRHNKYYKNRFIWIGLRRWFWCSHTKATTPDPIKTHVNTNSNILKME